MSANIQTSYAPHLLPPELLERPLEPQIAYAIDPPNTPEFDDAMAVHSENCQKGESLLTTVYIAYTALIGTNPEIFDRAHDRAFSIYGLGHSEYMLPNDINNLLSLGNNPEGSPAVAIDLRLYSGVLSLEGIRSVRVQVNQQTYDSFQQLAINKDPTALEIVNASIKLSDLGKCAMQRPSKRNSHAVVAQYMISANSALANFAKENGIPWIYRSCPKGSPDSMARYTHQPDYHHTLRCLYSHTTSPLRRFIDFVNIMQIAAFIDEKQFPFYISDMKGFAEDTNQRTEQLRKITA